MRFIRSVTVLAVGVVALAALAAPAGASDRPSRLTVRDGRHDVTRIAYRGGRPPVRSRAPGRREGNLVRMLVVHRRSTVTFRLRLAAIGRQGVSPFFVFKTPAGKLAAVVDVRVRPVVDLFTFRGAEEVACPAATGRVRRHAGVVRVSIPRSCFGEPSWVRARVTVFTMGRFTRHGLVEFLDAAPGRGIRFLGSKSPRVWAPGGAVVTDGPPPVEPGRHLAHPRLDLLRRLGRRT